MASKRIGDSTVVFENPPFIESTASVVGPKEGKGPLKGWFDLIIDDDMFGEKTPEKAERRFLTEAVGLAMDKVSLEYDAINYFLAGDLLNQIISANFTARQINVPFIGMYGACLLYTSDMKKCSEPRAVRNDLTILQSSNSQSTNMRSLVEKKALWSII